ncbi:MAG TPA: class I SAM-dependent methyltransferase [Vicinamibacterales bacterium]|nr:class I SAM-dependent methyltransferase [Vicinamibacterales bacterium]
MTAFPREKLLDLPARGAAGLREIMRMAARGDWQTRALCLSAAGRIARADPLGGRDPVRRWVARLLPGLIRRFPLLGYHRRYVRDYLRNALVDRSWIVRTSAALSLAECGAAPVAAALAPLLKGPYRAERIAAAAALSSSGRSIESLQASLLDGALPAPPRIGDGTRSLDFLSTLASCHLDVLEAWRRTQSRNDASGLPTSAAPDAWATFMAGPVTEETYEGPEAEIQRYAASDTAYLLAKPFSAINRPQNVRLLHSFLVVAEQLRVPPGGRILDLGGGPGWVSELLIRFGYRAFTLDLSSALLTIGRTRFAREGLTPRLVAGDMTRIPVASGSMDAVIVIDALHHVPDGPAVFREAHRVLADGGQFILAEPGEGHSETEKSQGEMQEHGVQEREIHVFEAARYGREAGFDDVRIIPHYVPQVFMTPDDLKHAMRAPADDWVIRREGAPHLFPQFVLQSVLDRPIVVFRKGERPLDSRMPRTLKAEIVPALKRDGTRVEGTVGVRNIGDTTWLGTSDEVGHVRLGIQLLGPDRRLLDMEFSRTPLAADVAPGGSCDVNVTLTLPSAASFVLKVDLVDEGICWFEDGGSRPAYVSL